MRLALVCALAVQAMWAAGSSLPPRFEENRGQFPSSVQFYARGVDPGISLQRDSQTIGSIKARFLGASTKLALEGVDQLGARTNYFGPNAATGVRNFSRIRYRDV